MRTMKPTSAAIRRPPPTIWNSPMWHLPDPGMIQEPASNANDLTTSSFHLQVQLRNGIQGFRLIVTKTLW